MHIMKKGFYLMIVLLSITLVSNGQLFVGGSVGVNTSGGKTEVDGNTEKDPSSVSFYFNPQAGYMLSDDFWVGLGLSLNVSSTNSNGDPEVKTSASSFGFVPFARYYFFRANKFSFYAHAQAGLEFGSSKTKSGDVTFDGPKVTEIGVNVFPGIAFDISDKFQLFASVNAFSLGINTEIEKDDDIKEVSTDAGFNVNMNNILTTGAITVGAYFKL